MTSFAACFQDRSLRDGVFSRSVSANHLGLLYDLNEQTGEYDRIERSRLFPNLNLNLLAVYVQPNEKPQAVKAFCKVLRRLKES